MVIIRGLKKSEFPLKLYELLELCFTGSREDKRFYKLHSERPYSIPDWKYSRVLLKDGKIISHVGIWHGVFQLAGGELIPFGGIRDVCTHPEYRKQGLATWSLMMLSIS